MNEETQEEDFSKLDPIDLLAHKKWNARVLGYETLTAAFGKTVSEDDPALKPFTNDPELLKRALLDVNANAQEKGFIFVNAYVLAAGANAIRTRETVLPAAVDKGLPSVKAKTKALAVELCLLYIEVEEKSDGVVNCIIVGAITGPKKPTPKQLIGAGTALASIVAGFGPKTINSKPILAILPTLFASPDKFVREAASSVYLEFYRYQGSAIEAALVGLEPLQIDGIKKHFFEKAAELPGGNGQQTRFTLKQQREREVKQAEGALEGNSTEADDQDEAAEPELDVVDAFDLSQPVDVMSKLPDGFHENMASKKWKDKKEAALDPLLKVISVPRIASNSNMADLVGILAEAVKDINVFVATTAVQCIEALARGLRADFRAHKGVCVPPLIDRLKEKKKDTVVSIGKALDAIFLCATFSDIIEDVTNASSHKLPPVRLEVLAWLTRSLATTKTAPNQTETKAIADLAASKLGDADDAVRGQAASVFAHLLKIVGERPLNAQYEALDDLKKARIKKVQDTGFVSIAIKSKGVGGSKAPVAASAPIAKAAASAPPKVAVKPRPVSIADKENIAPGSPSASGRNTPAKVVRPAVVKPVAPKVVAPAAVKKPAAPAASAKAPVKAPSSEPPKYRFTQEEAEAQLPGVLPDGIMEALADSVWKNRLEAMDERLLPWVKSGGLQNVDAELIVRAFAQKPGWKESNFQVWNKMIQILELLASESSTWTKGCMALCIPALTEKLGDMKIKAAAASAMTVFATKSSLQFVLSQTYDPLLKQKAPKAVADGLTWVDTALKEFGIAGLSLRELLTCLNTALSQTNPLIKAAALKALVTLRRFAGANIKDLLQGLTPSQESSIQAEFDKPENQTAPETTRTCADLMEVEPPGGKSAGKSKAAAVDPQDELFPRVDLDKILPSAMIKGLSDDNWKARKEALEGIQGILEANKRLNGTMTELPVPLKLRLADANKVVQNLALDILIRVAEGMGKPFERYARNLAPVVINVLADKNASTRATGLAALTAISDAIGVDLLIPMIAVGLEPPKFEQRKELLTWLQPRIADHSGLDLKSLTSAVIGCLEDPKSEIKAAAKAVLPLLVANAGYAFVVEQTNDLKPASRSAVMPFIEAHRPLGASVSAAAGPSNAAARPTAVPKSLKPQALPASPGRPASPAGRGRVPSVNGGLARPRASMLPTPEPVMPSEYPFKPTGGTYKLVRASKEGGNAKWTFEGPPRPDQVESLHQQIGPHVTSELLGLLFSKDHHSERDYLAALTMIDSCIPLVDGPDDFFGISADSAKGRILGNSDLLLKYLSLRLVDNSPTLNNRCLDVLDHLVKLFNQERVNLSDHEASCFLPTLIAKVGDQREHMRIRIRALLRSLTSIYAYSKVFSQLLEHGITSKNAKTRHEAVEEIGLLFQRQGMSVCQPSKSMPALLALVGDKDAVVRTSALSALATVYSNIGEELFRYTGGLGEREKGLLDEKLKRTAAPQTPGRPMSTPSRAAAAGGLPTPGPSAPRSIARPRGSTLPAPRRDSGEFGQKREASPPVSRALPLPRAIGTPTAAGRKQSHLPVNGHAARASLLPSKPGSPSSGDFEQLCTDIQSTDPNDAVDALKTVHKQLTDEPDEHLEHANALVDAASLQMRSAFDTLEELHGDEQLPMLRLIKHLLHVLNTLFDRPQLAQRVSRKPLVQLLAELTRHLLETADEEASNELQQISKVLNMVLIRIFHNADRNTCFGALFSVLQTVTANLRDLRGEDLANRAKYAELVMKCLWKVSKMSKDILEDGSLEPKQLLLDIDDFLQGISPAEWRRRSADNIPLGDMPLRTVKTILQQMVKVFGDAVNEHLNLVREGSFVHAYLIRLLAGPRTEGERPSSVATMASTGSTTPSDPVQTLDSPIEGLRSPPPTSEAEQELKEICQRIQDPGSSKQGIRDLYEFRKRHPDFEKRIAKWVSETGTHFQAYIRRTMVNLATDEGKGEPTPDSPTLDTRSSMRAPASPSPAATALPRSRVTSANPINDEEDEKKLASLQAMFRYRTPS